MLAKIEFKRAVPPAPPSQRRDLSSKKILDLSSGQVIQIIQETKLVEQEWYPYHAGVIRKIGPTRYLQLSDDAKLGSNPRTLFSYLLKQEMA